MHLHILPRSHGSGVLKEGWVCPLVYEVNGKYRVGGMESAVDMVVVDDDEMAIALVDRHLKYSKYSSRCFCLPDEAISYLSTSQPKILLVDYVMPKMDGIEFIKLVYSTHNSSIPAIYLCSSVELPNDVQQLARECGATPGLKEELMTKESLEELFVRYA